jgi:outer membrane protein assembly factor BamB
MRSRVVLGGIIAAAMLLFCVGCDEHSYLNVWIVSGPDHVAPGEVATFVVTSRANNWSPTFLYEMNWGDTSTTTPKGHFPGDTDRMTHIWRYPGKYNVWATAQLLKHQEYGYQVNSSAHRTVIVSTDSDPVIDSAQFYYKWRPIEFVAFAHHPRGESLRLAVAWGDDKAETTSFQSSPCRFSATHAYVHYGDMKVVLKALSQSGAVSAPETLSAFVTTTGEVASYWEGAYSGSPVVVGDVIYLVGPGGFCGLRDSSAQYLYPGSFVGHPSFSVQANHLYIGSEDGHLCAFTPALSLAWRYPDSTGESLPGVTWGSAAANGNVLYVPCSNDTVYSLVDDGTSVTRGAAFEAGQVDAVVIDAAGSVYLGSDSGYLYKLTADLNLSWRTQLQSGGRVFDAAIGADGTVYCTSDSNRVFAVDPADGSVRWTASLVGVCYRPVVGLDGLYACIETGILYKLNLQSGANTWMKSARWLGSSSPIVATGGNLYVQTDDDRVYCFNQSSGESLWVSNCAAYLPHGRRAGSTGGISSPAVDGDGDIYVVGTGALYKLSAYSPLDASSPWPKWQHDLYNTGYVGGGR